MKALRTPSLPLLLALTVLLSMLATAALAQKGDIPRTSSGKPDFTGFYNTATLTPLVRPQELGERMSLTDEEAAAIAKRKADLYAADQERSDPDREAPPVGGSKIFDPGLEVASGGSGGYNAFYMDPGDGAFKIDGEWRTSILIEPKNGQMPPMTAAAQKKAADMAMFMRANVETGVAFWIDYEVGPYDNMEQRPLAERCLLGFGSTAGPPMLPTLYNSMKRIVQNDDHVMILVEMQHDPRVFKFEGDHAPADVQSWLGDSVARWEGDTLVVTTKNHRTRYGFFKTSDDPPKNMTVTERFSYLDADTVLYNFTVNDPETWEASWTGEYVWPRSTDKIYEYACHEGNYAMGNIMRGARLLEADALAAKKSSDR